MSRENRINSGAKSTEWSAPKGKARKEALKNSRSGYSGSIRGARSVSPYQTSTERKREVALCTLESLRQQKRKCGPQTTSDLSNPPSRKLELVEASLAECAALIEVLKLSPASLNYDQKWVEGWISAATVYLFELCNNKNSYLPNLELDKLIHCLTTHKQVNGYSEFLAKMSKSYPPPEFPIDIIGKIPEKAPKFRIRQKKSPEVVKKHLGLANSILKTVHANLRDVKSVFEGKDQRVIDRYLNQSVVEHVYCRERYSTFHGTLGTDTDQLAKIESRYRKTVQKNNTDFNRLILEAAVAAGVRLNEETSYQEFIYLLTKNYNIGKGDGGDIHARKLNQAGIDSLNSLLKKGNNRLLISLPKPTQEGAPMGIARLWESVSLLKSLFAIQKSKNLQRRQEKKNQQPIYLLRPQATDPLMEDFIKMAGLIDIGYARPANVEFEVVEENDPRCAIGCDALVISLQPNGGGDGFRLNCQGALVYNLFKDRD